MIVTRARERAKEEQRHHQLTMVKYLSRKKLPRDAHTRSCAMGVKPGLPALYPHELRVGFESVRARKGTDEGQDLPPFFLSFFLRRENREAGLLPHTPVNFLSRQKNSTSLAQPHRVRRPCTRYIQPSGLSLHSKGREIAALIVSGGDRCRPRT